MLAEVADWFERRTSSAADYTVDELLAAKGRSGETVSVVLPARNEASTVGAIVRELRRLSEPGLIDQVLVVDSGSSDDTAARAAEAGAQVVRQHDLLADQGDRPGKGEALWKSLSVATGELVVFIDADLVDFRGDFVTGLLGPLLTDPAITFVKGTYDRPLMLEGTFEPTGGGRVTELVARPLLNSFWPELAGFVQPLGGEYAARRALLETLPFASGYGVDLGLLIDALERLGLQALAQVDLGRRVHHHQSDEALAVMAGQVMLAAWSRLAASGRLVTSAPPATTLTQFSRGPAGLRWQTHDMSVQDRPPLVEVASYRRRLAVATDRQA